MGGENEAARSVALRNFWRRTRSGPRKALAKAFPLAGPMRRRAHRRPAIFQAVFPPYLHKAYISIVRRAAGVYGPASTNDRPAVAVTRVGAWQLTAVTPARDSPVEAWFNDLLWPAFSAGGDYRLADCQEKVARTQRDRRHRLRCACHVALAAPWTATTWPSMKPRISGVVSACPRENCA